MQNGYNYEFTDANGNIIAIFRLVRLKLTIKLLNYYYEKDYILLAIRFCTMY